MRAPDLVFVDESGSNRALCPRYGYAPRGQRCHGQAPRKVVVAAARLDCKAAYVACSRGRQSCTVFTPEKESLFAGLPRSADRQAALDVLHEREDNRQLRASLDGQLARAEAMERTLPAEPAAPERSRLVVRTKTPVAVRTRAHARGTDLDLSR